jgi:hypothetical protein
MTSLTIPSSVTSIGDYAFEYCTGLTNVTIPNSVLSIGEFAFFQCSGLISVTVGNGVAYLGDNAFAWCTRLTGIYFEGNAPALSTINNGYQFFSDPVATAYYLSWTTGWYSPFAGIRAVRWNPAVPYTYTTNAGKITITGYIGSGGAVTIPATIQVGKASLPVTCIGQGAFYNCTNVTSVTIPGSVTNLGDYAFADCTSLMAVYFLGNAPGIGSNVFYGDSDALLLYVLPGTTGWDASGLPVVSWYGRATPGGATATATELNGFVVEAAITSGGSGYTNTPGVQIIGGGGSGATAVAVVSKGVVVSIIITSAGTGYTSDPVVLIQPPFIPTPGLSVSSASALVYSGLTIGAIYQPQQFVGWYWSNQLPSFTATSASCTQIVAGVASSGNYRLALTPVPAQAFATPKVVNGFVISATVTSGGSGYVTSPAVTIAGGGGNNATAVSQISGGMVTGITIISAGSGYRSAPTVEIAPPPAAAVSPTVSPLVQLYCANLVPYGNYQIQYKPVSGGTWQNWPGGLFSPTDVTSTQYLFVANGIYSFRLQYVP